MSSLIISIVVSWLLAAAAIIWLNIEELREVDNCFQWLAVLILLIVGTPFLLGAMLIQMLIDWIMDYGEDE